MTTRKAAGSGAAKRPPRTTRTAKRTPRRTATTSRRSSNGTLYPRRRTSRPGLPTTMGTALGTLVVTTLLDLSWPVRIALIIGVLVVGLVYVLWRHRAEIAAAGAAGASPGTDDAVSETPAAAPAGVAEAPGLPAPGDPQAPPST